MDLSVQTTDIAIDSDETSVFRDPVHGLIPVYAWEKALIDTEEFQRLRRIHQLSMTYLIYHGAEHTRFGHSIGVMHVAGRVMDHLRKFAPLKNLAWEDFREKRALVRMAALLHDIGHGCFSHVGESGESIYPDLEDPVNGEIASGHEVYTRCIIKERLAKVIEKHWPKTEKCSMVEDILMILSQGSSDPVFRFFDDIISGQLDCDKMDYLLRDSHYCGVEYGVFDLDKLIHSLRVGKFDGNNVLAISQNGIQAVEGFVLARYWMFIQVYFHKDRRLFDYYLTSFMREYLRYTEMKNGKYPKDIGKYIELDDAKIERAIQEFAKKADESDICYFAERIYRRSHHKVVFDPPYVHYNGKDEVQSDAYRRISYVNQRIKKKYGNNKEVYVDLAKGSTTKHIFDVKIYNEESDPDYRAELPSHMEMPAIPVISKHDGAIKPIQDYSFTLRSISDRKINILRVYADESVAEEVREKCNHWSTVEYTDKAAQLAEGKKKVEELEGELNKEQSRVRELEEELDTRSEL
mgnify:CR=1 FL=1